MARFDQKVNIDVEVNNLSKLEKIGDAAREISEAGEALDGFDESLQEVEADFDNLADSIDSQEGVFAGVGDNDDALADFRGSIRETHKDLSNLDDAMQGEMSIKAKVDKDDFIKQVKTDIEDRFDDDNVEVPVAPSSDLEQVDTSQLVRQINNEIIPKVEEEVDDIKPTLSDEVQGERGQLNTAELARKIGQDLEGVRQSDRNEITPRIAGEVKWSTDSAGGAKAMASYNTRITALQNRPGMKKLKPEMEGSVDFEGFDEDAFDLPEGMGEDIKNARKLAEETERLNERKESLKETQYSLGEVAEQTAIHSDDEANSFADLTDAGTDLADAKKAAKESNSILNRSMKKTAEEGAFDEMTALDEAGMSAKELLNELGVLSDEQANLEDQTGDTVHALTSEKSDADALAEGMDGLAGAKKAASNANSKLGADAEETSRYLQDEFDISKKNADGIAGVKEAHRDASRASRRLRNSVDETTDSMRAANKVGDLFEDGLGSLSVNLGAFTVALRNFLTQVPLLLAGLGALGAAASGVAASFIAAGGAIAGVIGAGVLARAQQLDEEFSQIEGTGEALQQILMRMRDLFVEAISPLTENAKTVEVFKQVVEGLAGSLGLVASTLDELMTISESDLSLVNEDATEGADEAAEDIKGITGLVDELGQRLAEPFRELNSAMSFAFINLQDEFVDMSAGIIQRLADLTRFGTKFTDGITESNGALEQFTQTLAEMAKVGDTLLAGLLPVFQAFSSIMETVAEQINGMNQQFVASLITFGAIIVALNRVSGFMSSFIGIIPNLVFGLREADGSAKSLIQSFAHFAKQSGIAGSGFIALSESIGEASDEMKLLRIRSLKAQLSLGDFNDQVRENTLGAIENSESMDELQDEIIDVAMAVDAGEESLKDYQQQLNNIGFSARFAEENLDDIDGIRDPGRRRSKAFSSASAGAGFGIAGEATGSALGKLGKKSTVAKQGLASIGRLLKKGRILKSLKALKGLTKALVPLLGGSLGPALGVVALGAGVLVGILGNLDQIMSTLSATMKALSALGEWVGKVLLELSIAIWNGLYDVLVGLYMIIRPFISLFKVFGSSSEDAGSGLDTLVAILDYAVDFTVALIDAIGGIIRIIGTFIGMLNQLVVNGFVVLYTYVKTIIAVMFALYESLTQNSEAFNTLGKGIDWVVGKLGDFMAFIKGIPKESQKQMSATVQIFQDGFNSLIETLNKFIEKANKLEQFDMEKMEKVDFGVSGGEGALVNQAEVSAGTESLYDSIAPSGSPSVSLEETNETNINQTVNADPEDKSQISRVVKDAMEEADSFSRRRNGFTGN